MRPAIGVLTWNLGRKVPPHSGGKRAAELVHRLCPDVAVLTETRTSFPAADRHPLASEPHPATPAADERKVVLWSKTPWTEEDDLGSSDLPPGRFIAGTTETSIGRVRVIDVCISWHMANVQYGSRDQKPWGEHLEFLFALREVIADQRQPTIVAGDFNQRVPRPGRQDVAAELQRCFSGYDICTRGDEHALIDHVAVGEGLAGTVEEILPMRDDLGPLSDHTGVHVSVAAT